MLNTYSFTQVHVSLIGSGGVIAMGSGAAPSEEGITIEMSEDADIMKIGADGQAMHSLNPSKAGKVTVRLLKTSPVNARLSALYNLQRLSPLLWASNILTLTDVARGDVYTCQSVAFVKHASNTYAKEGGTIEWEFNAGVIDPALAAGF